MNLGFASVTISLNTDDDFIDKN